MLRANAKISSTSVKPRVTRLSLFLRPPFRRAAGPLFLAARTVCLLGANRDQRLQLEEALFADPFHIHQLFDLLERTVLLAVIHNPLSGAGADARQCLQLSARGGIEVHGVGGSRLCSRGTSGLRRLW